MLQYMLVLSSGVIRDRKGVFSLEYAVLAFGIVGAALAATSTFSSGLSDAFGAILTELKATTTAS